MLTFSSQSARIDFVKVNLGDDRHSRREKVLGLLTTPCANLRRRGLRRDQVEVAIADGQISAAVVAEEHGSQLPLCFITITALLSLTSGRPIPPSPLFDFGNGNPATSDGLLMVDYLASAFNLPSPNSDFRQQKTFDYDVSTAMDNTFFLLNGMPQAQIIRNKSLHSQFDSFSDSLDSMCSSPQDCKSRLRKSVIVLDQIGSSDYQYSFLNGKSLKETYSYVESVVFTIQYIVQKLIEKGATKVLVTGTLPMGCLPGYLTLLQNQTQDYDQHGCLASMNTFSSIHNERLQGAILELKEKHPDVQVEFADTYKAFKAVVDNHALLGFNKHTLLKSCCGSGGIYSFDPEKVCGKQGLPVCMNPSSYLNWDGFHLTQEAMKLVVDGLLFNRKSSLF
ncbi:GDSL esterase/lipase At1g28650 [Linum grandiflorum]